MAASALYRRGLAHSLYLRHINSVYLNHPDDDLAHEALDIFVQLGDLVGQGNVLNNLGISAYYRGAWDEALQHYGASRDVRERTGDLIGAATEENNIGEILSDQGHFGEAWGRFKAAVSSWRSACYPVDEVLVTSNLGRLAARTVARRKVPSCSSRHAPSLTPSTPVRTSTRPMFAYWNAPFLVTSSIGWWPQVANLRPVSRVELATRRCTQRHFAFEASHLPGSAIMPKPSRY